MNIVEANLQELFGVICWEAKWDFNLNLSINFGQPHLSIREPKEVKADEETIRQSFRLRQVTLHGEWLLWILSGYWKLSIKDFGEVTSASPYKRKRMALARLEGQKLIHARVNSNTSATCLDFDLGAKLSIRRISIKDDGDIWSLYKPNRYVLSVRADGKYNDILGDTDPDKIEWKPIVMV
jgi:hypothetical protein